MIKKLNFDKVTVQLCVWKLCDRNFILQILKYTVIFLRLYNANDENENIKKLFFLHYNN